MKIALPRWVANLKGPPRDHVKDPKGSNDPCDCTSSSIVYQTVCLSCISKNFDTIMTVQKPLKSSLAEFTHEQPLSSDQKQALKIHNQAREAASQRSSVARPALAWNPHLATLAEQWAKHLAADNTGLKHSMSEERPGQGENLYWLSAGGTLSDASQSWVTEAYHGEKIGEGKFESYGHYTQVIWPSTTKMGLASAKSSNGSTFIVGRYSAPGNFMGHSAFTGK